MTSRVRRTCLFKGGTRLFVLTLADYSGDDDGRSIFPGHDLIAADCQCSIRSIQDLIREVRKTGVLKVVGASGSDLADDEKPIGGRGQRTEYRLDLERLDELQALHQAREPNCEHCQARAKRAKNAASKRTKNAARKGENSSAKDENSRIAYKDSNLNNHNELAHERALSPEGRALVLAKALGESFEVYFRDAKFVDGPPARITLSSAFKASHARTQFGNRIRRIFGDDVVLDHADGEEGAA
ncbi:MAG TPA: helix-turn-helix domain-containing protein [Rhizomicrobium sp.]|nr:helix-turn-helix domain-containing protein [Rhizomicrobium sp.]